MNRLSTGCVWPIAAAWLSLWTASTLALDGKYAHSLFKQQRALSFSTVEGTVTDSEVVLDTSHEDPTYRAKISYRYVVGGRQLTGERFRYGNTSGDCEHVQKIVRAHPRTSQVTVYYNPANPVDALLDPGVSGEDFYFSLFIAPFNMVLLGSWGVAAWALQCGPGITPRSLRLYDQGTELRVRRPRLWPVLVAACAAFVVSGAGYFAVGLIAGAAPPKAAVAAAWGVVLAVATLAYFLAASSVNDLVIDRVGNTLTLPRSLRRGQPTPICLDAILDIELREEPAADSGQQYSCVVRWRNADGQASEANWIKQPDKGCAEQLVAWLRHQCQK